MVVFICIMILFYIKASSQGLIGRRGGPQDAFRHSYASAVVSRYLGPRVVDVFTAITEKDEGSIYDHMDRHNNMVGKQVGQMQGEIEGLILEKIKKGRVNNPDTSELTWLHPMLWEDRDLFN